MKKILIICSSIALLFMSLVFVNNSEASELPTPPKAPVESVITHPANADKQFPDVETFLQGKNSKANEPNAVAVKYEKILYKNVNAEASFFNIGIAHSISPDRQVYLIVSDLNQTEFPRTGTVTNVRVYEIYDAETGDLIQSGFKKLN